jgi:hypothetical protein
MFSKNCSNASNPPADAPIPIMGKSVFTLLNFGLGVLDDIVSIFFLD